MITPLLFCLACNGRGADSAPDESSTESRAESSVDDSEIEAQRWTGAATVVVVDPDGAVVEGAVAMVGGWPEDRWVTTDAEGLATLEVDDDGITERHLLAGKEGWISGSVAVPEEDPTGPLTITMRPLLGVDNVDYPFQKGGDIKSPDTSYCGHCHWDIAGDWADSTHAKAASDPQVWDIYTGRASETDDCDALGGSLAEGQLPGEEGTVAEYCYLGEGVLPWLNEGCGPACDHPDRRDTLTAFGSCGDCHTPATDGGTPGSIDFAASTGVAHEGVTCDFCHKIRSVVAGPAPGLDGAIQLERPSEESRIGGQEFDPIIFGPYPDVVVPIMNGSYNPLFREARFCSACHEYYQPALGPGEELDSERWPDGLPVLETFSEFEAAGSTEAGFSCQGCHMPTLELPSSTYDIVDRGQIPSTTQGWLREAGEVRHHHFPRADDLGDPYLLLSLEEQDGELRATVELTNRAAHAVPTGEPLRQIIVLVSALDADGQPVEATGGQVVPDVGGYLAMGTIGADASVSELDLELSGQELEGALIARFVRPTGEWTDYSGPGTTSFAEATAAEKGLPVYEFLGEVELSSITGDSAILASQPPETRRGDVVFLCAEGHHAGAPGWLYAKVLVDSEGRRGVAHYRALDVASDNRIAAFSSATSEHRFPSTAGLTVTATVVRRDYGAAVAERYGWDFGDRDGGSASESY